MPAKRFKALCLQMEDCAATHDRASAERLMHEVRMLRHEGNLGPRQYSKIKKQFSAHF